MVALLMHNAMIIKHSLPSLDVTVRTEKSRWAASFLKCCRSFIYLFVFIERRERKGEQ